MQRRQRNLEPVSSVIGGVLIGDGGIVLGSVGGGFGLGLMLSPLFIHDTFTHVRN